MRIKNISIKKHLECTKKLICLYCHRGFIWNNVDVPRGSLEKHCVWIKRTLSRRFCYIFGQTRTVLENYDYVPSFIHKTKCTNC